MLLLSDVIGNVSWGIWYAYVELRCLRWIDDEVDGINFRIDIDVVARNARLLIEEI